MQLWSPQSWQTKPCQQPIVYPDKHVLNTVVAKLSALPPLVTPLEIIKLKQALAEAALGKRFLLQGGDCAESFSQCNPEVITNKLKILLQMSLVLIHGLRIPIVRVGRIAGQYAKPRSQDTETKDGITLPSYRGDLYNKPGFSLADRTPDPELMWHGYSYAAMTLNYIRALVDGGFADLQHPEYWNLDFIHHSPLEEQYRHLVNSIGNAIDFMKTISGMENTTLNRVDFYTSHEALNLYYEQALTRQHAGKWYNLATHYPWIGMRTAQLDSAHVEFFRGIANPVAVKIGPSSTPEQVLNLIAILNPENEPGKLTLTMRLGANKIAELLPKYIDAVQQQQKTVLWVCDPMHGNTETTAQGIKTRRFEHVVAELQQSFAIHEKMGSHLGGVHLELTGENVTECVGGARGLAETDLHRAYESLVDPRLNYEQALEMALAIAQFKK